MSRSFLILDVFTDRPYGGNQLAVLPDAQGLSDVAMQAIAHEFNFSETTFVLPTSDPEATARVRIFTPTAELPFAGHPNIGTAYALALTGRIAPQDGRASVRFEEGVGLVELSLRFDGDRPAEAELVAPQPLDLVGELDPADVAVAIGLEIDDVVGAHHRPTIASVGAPFAFVELRDRATLARARPLHEPFELHLPAERVTGLAAYVRDDERIEARVFVPLYGILEDPATGSAAAALAGLLASLDPRESGELSWTIAQGAAIDRPSRIIARATKSAGRVGAIRVGGEAVLVARGTLEG